MIWLSTVIIEFINATLHLFIAYFLFHSFWKLKWNKIVNTITFLALDICFTSSLLFLKGSFLHTIVIFILTVALSFLFKGKFVHRLVYTAIIFGVFAASEMIVAVSINEIYNLTFIDGKTGPLYIMGILFSKFFTLMIVIAVRIKKHSPLLSTFKQHSIMIFAFPFATFAIIILQHAIFILNPNQSDFISVAVLICYTILIVSNVLIFEFIDMLYKNTLNESKVIAADEIIANQTAQYQALIEHHNDIIRIRHDHKNFCIGLRTEINNGNITEALSKLDEEYETCNNKIDRPNDIIHSIVDIKCQIAEKHDITIDFEYHALQKLMISPIDIAIVLGNAIDNAIEATIKISDESKKRIKIFITLNNNSIITTIKNNTAEVIDVSNLASKKSNIDYHGFGIISMKQIVNKYNGDVVFSYEDYVFTTSIVLHNFPSR